MCLFADLQTQCPLARRRRALLDPSDLANAVWFPRRRRDPRSGMVPVHATYDVIEQGASCIAALQNEVAHVR
jgi:hypothetical protein